MRIVDLIVVHVNELFRLWDTTALSLTSCVDGVELIRGLWSASEMTAPRERTMCLIRAAGLVAFCLRATETALLRCALWGRLRSMSPGRIVSLSREADLGRRVSWWRQFLNQEMLLHTVL